MPNSRALSDLISPEYLAEQKRLHADPRGYGGRGSKWAAIVHALIEMTHARRTVEAMKGGLKEADGPTKVLDYGCGQATLGAAVMQEVLAATGRAAGKNEDYALECQWRDYDPALVVLDRSPDEEGPFHLVVCTDVLEHIEPEKIDGVLQHLRQLTADGGELFTVISLVETEKKLSDGRQAHILLRDPQWWYGALAGARFALRSADFPNPKPLKQMVCAWRAV